MSPKVVVALIAAAIYLIIATQNTEITTLKVFFWEFSMSRIFLFSIMVIIGFVLGYVVGKVIHSPKKDISRAPESKANP